MSIEMEKEIKRWTARRKSALVMEIIQGATTVAEASRRYDLAPSELEQWVDDGKRGMENALKARPEDVREQYERQLKDLAELRLPHNTFLHRSMMAESSSYALCTSKGSLRRLVR